MLQTREAMRRVWIAAWWDALLQDAHYTWRSWRRHPGFALGAILVLALGLGSSTALFAALDRVLFRPLPYADPDRLVSVGLLGTAAQAAVPYLEKALAERATIDLKPFASDARNKIAAALADFQKNDDGVRVTADITTLRLADIAFDSKTLRVIAEANGSVNVALTTLPAL